MGTIASASDEAMRKRKAARQTNHELGKMLGRDSKDTLKHNTKRKVLYFSVNESQPSLEILLNFLVRYHHSPMMLHSLIVEQMRHIIEILQILNTYDKNNKNCSFYCRESYSIKWIMSMYQSNIVLTYEQGKKILKVWNDNSTQTLMLLIQKYHVENTSSMDNSTTNDKHYYDFIKPYLVCEYPIDYQFCQHFITNILKYCFREMTIETHFERQLFLKCLTMNGKLPLTKRELVLQLYKLSGMIFYIRMMVNNYTVLCIHI